LKEGEEILTHLLVMLPIEFRMRLEAEAFILLVIHHLNVLI
jgi:hypothetical protein